HIGRQPHGVTLKPNAASQWTRVNEVQIGSKAPQRAASIQRRHGRSAHLSALRARPAPLRAQAPAQTAPRTMTPLPNTIRDLRVLSTPRPCTILLQFPPPISTPLGSRRSLAVFPPFCLHPYLCPPHTISPAPPASTSLPPA